jgi:hypothetical protein
MGTANKRPLSTTSKIPTSGNEKYISQQKPWVRDHSLRCGSGSKFVHILGEFETLGIDLPEK